VEDQFQKKHMGYNVLFSTLLK